MKHSKRDREKRIELKMGKKCGFFNINFLPSVQTDANDD